MRVLKIVRIVFALLLVLAGAAVAAVVFGGERFVSSFIQGHGSSTIGRKIQIGGEFHIAWGRPTRIVAEDVHVANADWGSRPEMFTARRIELEVQPWPLLRGKIIVPRLALDAPDLLLETSSDGKKNWDFFAAKSATPQKRTQFPDLHEFQVATGVFTWKNGATGATDELGFEALDVKAPDTESPIAIEAKGTFQKKPYQFAASVGALKLLQDSSKPYPVKLDGQLAGNKVAIEGGIAEPMEFEGVDLNVALDGKNLAEFLNIFTIPLPDTPQYHLAGRVKHDQDAWSIEELDGKLGQSRLGGGVSVDVGGKVPYIKANLTSKYLDLADFKGFVGGDPKKEPPKNEQQKKQAAKTEPKSDKDAKKDDRVIPDTRLPFERLPGINVDLSLDAPQVKPTAGLPFERVNLVLVLKDGALTLKPLRFAAATGEVTMEMAWRPGPQEPDFEANIDVRHIDLKRLFAGMDTPEMLKDTAGLLGGYIKFKSKGATERQVLANADGDMAIFMEGGQFSRLLVEVVNLNVLNALGVLAQGDKPQPINCLVIRMPVARGIATAETLLLDTTDTEVEGRGNINFADETLYLDLIPHHKRFRPLTLRSPIEVRGTFRDPKFRPSPVDLVAKLGAAIGIGIVAPPAALLPLIRTGLGPDNACQRAFAQNTDADAASGGSEQRTQPPNANGTDAPPQREPAKRQQPKR